MLKKNLYVLLIVLLALLLIALVIWYYNRRIEGIDNSDKQVFNSQPK